MELTLSTQTNHMLGNQRNSYLEVTNVFARYCKQILNLFSQKQRILEKAITQFSTYWREMNVAGNLFLLILS